MTGWGIRLGLHLVKGIGEEQQARPGRGARPRAIRGPGGRGGADRPGRGGGGAVDPRRGAGLAGPAAAGLLWPLREVAGASKGRVDGRTRGARGITRVAGRPMDLRLPATEAPVLPPLTEPERLGDAYAVVGLDARLQAVALFRGALDRLGAVTNGSLAERRPGRVSWAAWWSRASTP